MQPAMSRTRPPTIKEAAREKWKTPPMSMKYPQIKKRPRCLMVIIGSMKAEATVRYFAELEFAVRIKPGDYSVDYEIFEIVGTTLNGEILFERDGATSRPDAVESIDEAQLYAHGSVKWDGCSNWYFDITDDCMLHACGRETLLNLGKILEACWMMTKEFCPHWMD
jgi:hypothetical protein